MKPIPFIIFLFLAFNTSFAQIFKLDSLPLQQPIYLTNGWKWHDGDNSQWAKNNFDDSRWENFNPGQAVYYLPQLRKSDNGWLRLTIDVDSTMVDKNMMILLNQAGATQIFLDGKLINQLGTVGDSTKEEKTYFNLFIPQFTNLTFSEKGLHTLAIRYSFNRDNINHFGWFTFLTVAFTSPNLAIEVTNDNLNILNVSFLVAGVLLLLFIFFVLIYHLGNKNTFNLNIVFYSFCTWVSLLMYTSYDGLEYEHAILSNFINLLFIFLLEFFFLNAIYIIFHRKRGIIFYSIGLIQFFLLSGVYMFFEEFALYKSPIQSLPYILVSLESLRICFIGIQKQQKGATIIFWGQLVTIIAYLGLYSSDFSFLLFQKIINVPFVFQTIAFVIHLTASPITIAYLIAKDFVDNSKSLEKKISEVENLSVEKQQILAAQNELLEQQVEARTAELRASQNQLIQKEKLASLGELTAGIAHEIQNPLNFVNNFSEVSIELVSELEEEQQNPTRDTQLEAELLGDLKQNLQKITNTANALPPSSKECSNTPAPPLESANRPNSINSPMNTCD